MTITHIIIRQAEYVCVVVLSPNNGGSGVRDGVLRDVLKSVENQLCYTITYYIDNMIALDRTDGRTTFRAPRDSDQN